MELKLFLIEVGRLILYSLYPLFMLYTNFIFLGVFVLDPKKIGNVGVLILFVIFNILQTFIIVYYILIFTSDNKSTKDIFPMTSDKKIERNFSNINPFVAEAIQKSSIESTHICSTCQTYKPPRCHHCRRCNKCYLKMDHHCSFLDVCIGFHNYKFFIQFLIANVLFIIFYLVVIEIDTKFGSNDLDPGSLVNLVISTLLSGIVLAIVVVILIFHYILISNNETTIEYAAINEYLSGDHSHRHVFQEGPITKFGESKDRKVLNPYNLGRAENWREIFGNTILEWLSPSFTSSGDGITFKKNYVEKDELFFKF